jgi:hypothetical protein
MKIENLFLEEYSRQNSIEDGLKTLKENGVSQLESLQVLIKVLKLSLKEADSIILNSITWKEQKEDIEKFRDGFGKFLNDLPDS